MHDRTDPQTLLDAAENVVIAAGMGWDMAGVLAALAEAVDRERGKVERRALIAREAADA